MDVYLFAVEPTTTTVATTTTTVATTTTTLAPTTTTSPEGDRYSLTIAQKWRYHLPAWSFDQNQSLLDPMRP